MFLTDVEPDTFTRNWLARPSSTTDFSCIAELDGQVVAMGFAGVVSGLGQAGMPQLTEGVIGYLVDPGFAGRGIGSALAQGLLAASFLDLRLRRVTATCNADNPASVRVLE